MPEDDPVQPSPVAAPATARPAGTEPSAPSRPERRISLAFDVFAVSQRLGAYLDRALEGTGIRPAEYAVYSLMLEAGPRTPSELAAMLGMPPSTLSTYLGAMLSREDARRIPNPADGRSVRVVLTDRGRAVVRRVNPPFSRAHQALDASLDRPAEEIRAVLVALGEAIERASDSLAAQAEDQDDPLAR
jgi:DNA-binding MarR family transcriptional regulator